ncbi:MAG: homoserine O-acetyltransferase [Solirubrobacteraceae bacterium]|nr:homoserine O-acetyltransferase [Solirubrobacteraceae bacterium]
MTPPRSSVDRPEPASAGSGPFGVGGAGVGPVRTQHVVVATAADPLELDCGRRLGHVEVGYETYGRLDPDGGNAVYLCHALTGDAHAAGIDGVTGAVGWWDALIGPGRAIDTDRWFVVCGTLLGSCLGTTGPTTADPATGRPYGLDFPPLTIADQARVHRRLCRALGIDRLHAVIGPSVGGMHALQWFLDAPEEIGRTVLIASSGRLTVENRAFSAAGRQAILDDPGFDGGRYLERGGPGPVVGLAAARRFAHITYVSGGSLQRKLGDAPPSPWPPREAADWLAPGRAIERYLEHQGRSFLDRFDALSYLYLTRPMDDFDPFGEQAAAAARSAVQRNPAARHRVISFDSDWRFGADHSRALVDGLRAAGALDVSHQELAAPWGHDAFLLEVDGFPELIAESLR